MAAKQDANQKDLSAVVKSLLSKVDHLYQLDTNILILHKSCGGVSEYIRTETTIEFAVVNPTADSSILVPFRTTVPNKLGPDDKPAFRLLEYSVREVGSDRVLFAVDPEEVALRVDKETKEIEYYSKQDYSVGGSSSVRVKYASERVIPYHDTYKYIAQLRPLRDLEITYDYSRLAAAHKWHGMDIKPKLTVISTTAKVKQLDTKKKEPSIWRISGWILPGNGIVLSW